MVNTATRVFAGVIGALLVLAVLGCQKQMIL
jgi:hypothetical protein